MPRWTDEQWQAIEKSGSNILVSAGAGSGKTRVITTKIAYLINQKNVNPSSILSVTFTKKPQTKCASEQLLLNQNHHLRKSERFTPLVLGFYVNILTQLVLSQILQFMMTMTWLF